MYWIFIAFTLFSRSLCGKIIDKALTGLPQDDPELIKIIHEQFLISPKMGMSYNLSKHHQSKFDNSNNGQFGQALEVAKLFEMKQNGFFIEAGAFDGEIFSNTLLLEMNLNWTGLLIEPNPEIFQTLLTKNRKSYAIETCLSTKPIVTEVSFDVAGKQQLIWAKSKKLLPSSAS